MKFRDLLQNVEVSSSSGDAEISSIEYDSRRIQPGSLFVAMRGESTDGNRYIAQAIDKGAVAMVSDNPEFRPSKELAFAVVPHGRRALAQISAEFYGHPGEKLKATGVTGTNGKTTTTFLIESFLKASGRPSALLGTIEYHIGNRVLPSPHTTPESLDINKFLAEAVSQRATEMVMEVSSHALEQGRVWGIAYDVAVFTNLTRDHLDYHKTMENYFDAKAMLFQGCGTPPPRVSIINVDDEFGRQLVEGSARAGSKVIRYGIRENGDCRAEEIEYDATGTKFRLRYGGVTINCRSQLVGEVNVYNVMAAALAALSRGCSAAEIETAVDRFGRVSGRFEQVAAGQPFTVIVDYAHTDDALRNLIRIARNMLTTQKTKGRIITLFGCGGDRDRTKRPLMGRAAGEGSDFVVLTSDNPRSEDPMAIINEARVGLEQTKVSFTVEADRAKAINIAVNEARPGDIVLIAGKGHEKYQITRQGTFPFDDVEVAQSALSSLGFARQEISNTGVPVA
jgi:UDP-N-acetylmuramoyl-L-alanyl-D-glutamate--2,6-diaminopimelate ligase